MTVQVTMPVVRIERFEDDFDDFDEIDEPEEEYDPGEDCGRWDQNAKGGMSPYCRLAGTEFCDWECPYSR